MTNKLRLKLLSISTLYIILFSAIQLCFFTTLHGFGKNKVQYSDFDFKYQETKHFKIYFSSGGEQISEFVANVAENFYKKIRKKFKYNLKRKIPIIVYNSHNDFKQTNVIMELIEQEVGGFTEIFKDRVVIPYQGSMEDLRHVVEHELVHAIVFEMIYGSNILETMMSLQNMIRIPLWFMEGLAEYESLDWDYKSDMFVRDAVINDNIHFYGGDLYGFLVYKGGAITEDSKKCIIVLISAI